MDLQDFVKETMLQIGKGAIKAHKELSDLGGLIPDTDMEILGDKDVSFIYDKVKVNGSHIQRMIVNVDFDVAVTISESSKKNIGGNLTVASLFSLAKKSENNNETSAISRIKFTLPLVLPKTNSNKIE